MAEKPRLWEPTREQNLLRNSESGRYYGRFTLSGKQKWISLETDVFSTARLRLADERAKLERLRQFAADVQSGDAKMGALVELYRKRIEDRVGIRPDTLRRLREEVDGILKTWPGFENLLPRKVTRQAIEEWRNRLSREGTGFRPPGSKAKPEKKGASASLINKCIDALRRMLDIAVERGQLAGNPLYARGMKLKNAPRKPSLPEASKLTEIFLEIENGGGRFSRGAANFCRFLAYTGCRLREAQRVAWGDVDFKRGIVRVRGSKTEAANREVPMIPAARALLKQLHEAALASKEKTPQGELQVDPSQPVLSVGEARLSLGKACKKLGIERLTHHDLRDAFATAAIEAGVDIPTVAAWLGHADGGALLMRVYSHHRRAHSIAQAAKVMVGVDS